MDNDFIYKNSINTCNAYIGKINTKIYIISTFELRQMIILFITNVSRKSIKQKIM